MIASEDGEEIVSDEDALAFLFAVHASVDGSEGVFRVPQPRRHWLIDRALHQIVTQFEVELAIPWVKGKFSGTGATVIYLDEPDFTPHTKLYDPNSFGVIETHTEKCADDGSIIYTGFDAYVRLGESSTWLCIGIKPSTDDASLLDLDEEETTGNELDILGIDEPLLSDDNEKILCDIAAQIATAEGFGSVALRVEPRERFAAKFVKARMSEFVELGDFVTEDKLVYQAGDIARNYWEFAVVPMRAKALTAAGKTASQIAKEMGITKQRAERAVELDIENVINSDAINSLVRRYESP